MRLKYKIKLLLFALMNTLFITNSFSQAAAATAPAAGASIPVNTILCCIALVLLFIIIVMAGTVNGAIELYKSNKQKTAATAAKQVSVLLGLMLLSQYVFGQDAAATAAQTAASSAATTANIYFYGFITIIIVEVAVILFFIKALRFLTGIEQLKKEKVAKGEDKTFWEKINQFKPLEEEDNMDTGHYYDGIRELDNITPPWFIAGFAATILFAAVYLYRFHIAESALTQEQELAIEMKDAQILQDSLLKLEGNKVDENSVAMLDATGIAAGKKLYDMNCVACHGDKGQGGVGPNMTDNYWIHGGSIKDVFKSIKYGWVEKGMKSWKDDFSPTQIAQLSSYVESLKGTNPPGAKEKQGELYVEEAVATVTDSTKAK
jgi:cytochrome c oxidase cbb3-type subunit 3